MSGPSVSATFSYDALGRRISKTINGVKTDYQYDGNDIVAEIGGGAVGATYVRSLNIDEPFARIIGNGTEFYHTDALGSVFALTDAYGNTTATYTYDPFGNTTQTGISSNPFQYTGRENDGTGLLYFRARYYSPTLQRFISEDPAGTQDGFNLYSYVANNPLKFGDPTGLAKICCRLLDSFWAGTLARLRHCYIVADDGTTYGLYPDGNKGVPRINDPRDTGGACFDCPSASKCTDQNQCLQNANTAYSSARYSAAGLPNSNTYAGYMARSCCKGGVPKGAQDLFGPVGISPPPRGLCKLSINGSKFTNNWVTLFHLS